MAEGSVEGTAARVSSYAKQYRNACHVPYGVPCQHTQHHQDRERCLAAEMKL